MEKNTSYILVGLFVILALGILISTTIWLAFGGTERIIYREYETYMDESVSGLNKKALVKYLGVEVGYVKDINLNLDKPHLAPVRLTLDIESNTPIKTDTYSILTSQGITGLTYLELSGGSHQAPLLATDDKTPPIIRSRPSVLIRLDTAMTEGFNKFNQIANNLTELLNADNRQYAQQIMANVATLTAELKQTNQQFQQMLGTASHSLHNLDDSTQALPNLVRQIEKVLVTSNTSIATFAQMSKSIEQTSQNSQQTLAHTTEFIQQTTQVTLPLINQLLTRLTQLTTTYQHLGQQLQQTPNSLIFGKNTQRGPGE